jgi:PAS domain S-box-containing protein
MFTRQPLTEATLHALALVNNGIALAIDRKQAEEVLQQNEQLLRSIINNTSAAIYVKDLNSRYLLINSHYEKLFNITAEEIRGQSVYDIFPKEVADAFRANDLRVLQTGTAVQSEEVVPQTDGLHTYLSVKFPLFDAAGKPYAVGGISTDITARKRMEEALREREERLRAIIDTTPECVKLLDGDGTVLEMNAAGLTLIEADSAEAIIGRSVYSLIAAEYRAAFRAFSERICRGDKGHLEFEIIGLRGLRRWMETHAVPLRNQADGTSVQLAITRDITARKRAEEEREPLHTQLLQAQKMEAMGILAGGIAHDFNNILASILGYTELALDDVPQDSPARWRLQEVLTAGKRARDLVQQILAFSRRSEPKRQPIQLHSVVQDALRLLRASLPAIIDIRPHLDTTSSTVLADPTQMHQVLMNLCSNAEHAMRQTGGVLEMRLTAVEVTTDFAAAHPPLQPGAHLQSTPGQGTTFDLYFSRSASSAVDEGAEEALPRGQGRILFVDDEAPLVRLAQRMLVRLGYEVLACMSGAEALEAFQAAPQECDLVITDQIMPHMTGEALARALHKIRPEIPIILCTGFSHALTAEKVAAVGINAYLMKPLVSRELGLAIRHVLDQCSA